MLPENDNNEVKLPVGYEYVKKIGQGGQATVWMVRNNKATPPRYEALKVLDGRGKKATIRFLKEMDILSHLKHRNIVNVLYINPENHYFIMDYYGNSVDRYMSKPNYSLYTAVQILQKVANGIAFAHQHNIIHRDLKPSNILLSKKMEPKIADFGVVKIVEDNQEPFTATEDVIGSAPYMSPEQWEQTEVDYRCDIWALGIILYQMITRQLPFPNASGYRLAKAIIMEPITVPENIDNELCDLGKMLKSVSFKAVEKNPKNRYQKASDMAKDIQKVLNKYANKKIRDIKKGYVFVADADANYISCYKNLFSKMSLEVIMVKSCGDLAKKLETTTPQLLLVDNIIPKLSVLKMANIIQQKNENIPFVMSRKINVGKEGQARISFSDPMSYQKIYSLCKESSKK